MPRFTLSSGGGGPPPGGWGALVARPAGQVPRPQHRWPPVAACRYGQDRPRPYDRRALDWLSSIITPLVASHSTMLEGRPAAGSCEWVTTLATRVTVYGGGGWGEMDLAALLAPIEVWD